LSLSSPRPEVVSAGNVIVYLFQFVSLTVYEAATSLVVLSLPRRFTIYVPVLVVFK
jgi:hypothetical protein